MKKLILYVASLGLVASVNAQLPTEPSILVNSTLTATSPKGLYCAGANPLSYGVDVLDWKKGEIKYFIDEENGEEYSLGTGANSISDNGIVVIGTSYFGLTAAYIENGEIKALPATGNMQSNFANCITPDGSRIAGNAGVGMSVDYDGVMQHPVIWDRKADGTYSDPVYIPYPDKDPYGYAPQYVLVDGISADGKTLCCMMRNYSGYVEYPLVIKQDENGEWSYTYVGLDLISQEGLDVPGEAPDPKDYLSPEGWEAYKKALANVDNVVEPMPMDFMTEEEIAAWQAAWDLYMSDYYNNPYPNIQDYMTEEEKDAYWEAINQYYKDLYPNASYFLTEEEAALYKADYEEWEIRDQAYWAVMSTMPSFIFNQCFISQNGRYYAVAASIFNKAEWTETYYAYIFDLETGDYYVKNFGYISALVNYVSDDGRIIAATPYDYIEPATFVTESLEGDPILFQDYVKAQNPEVYEWMEANMVHAVVTWDYANDEEIVEDRWMIGIPSCNADMSMFVTWNLNLWDTNLIQTQEYMYTYFIPVSVNNETGISKTEDLCVEEIHHNLSGQRVGSDYKGLVISGGKIKFIK